MESPISSSTVRQRIEEGRKQRDRASRQAHAHLHAKQRKVDPIDCCGVGGRTGPSTASGKYARMQRVAFRVFPRRGVR